MFSPNEKEGELSKDEGIENRLYKRDQLFFEDRDSAETFEQILSVDYAPGCQSERKVKFYTGNHEHVAEALSENDYAPTGAYFEIACYNPETEKVGVASFSFSNDYSIGDMVQSVLSAKERLNQMIGLAASDKGERVCAEIKNLEEYMADEYMVNVGLGLDFVEMPKIYFSDEMIEV